MIREVCLLNDCNGMRQPLVSIVTPSFNQGRFIEDAILSIKLQTYKCIEYIIIDGGSTDDTLDIIRRYEGSYNLRWLSEPDEGMYDAINKGLRMASGDVLCYLNCDDEFFPWSVATAVKHLERYDLVFGDHITLREGYDARYYALCIPFHRRFYQAHGIFAQPTVFFKRKVYETIGDFDGQQFTLIADCDYWLRAIEAGFSMGKIWEIQAIQRDHSETQRARHREKLMQEFINLRRIYAGPVSGFELFFWKACVKLCWRALVILFVSGALSRLWPNYRATQQPPTWQEVGEVFKRHRLHR